MADMVALGPPLALFDCWKPLTEGAPPLSVVLLLCGKITYALGL